MSKEEKLVKCIFCLKEKEPSIEHVIPESIGGVLTINYLCRDCNSELGSKADVDLNKHRNIYDTYQKVKDKLGKELKFHFIDSHLEYNDGTRIKASKTNIGRKIVPTKLENGQGFLLDESSDDWIIHNIRLRAKDLCMGVSDTERIISRYLFFKLQAGPGDRFYDRATGVSVLFHQTNVTPVNTMKMDIPHRFVAKACVEVAHIYGYQDEIVEIDLLREHALYGNHFNDLQFRESYYPENPFPGHTLVFHNNEFSVQFFSTYAAGVIINWRNQPKPGVLVNHVSEKEAYIGEIKGDAVSYTNRPIEIKPR
jgi:hypothetical protein